MVNFTMHLTNARLTEFAQLGRRIDLSIWEKKHVEDCVECLRGLITALKRAIEQNKKERVPSIR